MEAKVIKSAQKKASKLKAIRINQDIERQAEKLLNFANKKKGGRRIKIYDILTLALELVTEEHLKILQDRSLTNEDRKEILRQKYMEIHGHISKDDFIGFMMKTEFIEFASQHGNETKAQ